MIRIPVRRALLSVYDKTGLIEFAERLVAADVEVVSSGGTARALMDAGIAVTEVSDVTGAPEMLGGRVKTLHPRIHGGILADLGNETHRAELEAQGIEPFQLVVTNLYPFEDTVGDPTVTEAAAIEQIDIGGPAMVRAAAKNHAWVGVLTDPARYDEVASAVESGGLDDDLRRSLAKDAFYLTAAYDAAIVCWLGRRERVPERLVLALERTALLRYGENPHQEAAIYARSGTNPWWKRARQVQGKEMSFNNYADAEAAWRLAMALRGAGAVVVKHTNPCGAAVCDSIDEAFVKAWECDPLSAFGGVVGLNRPLDATTAELVAARFVEVLVVPGAESAALEVLAAKKNLRVLVADPPENFDLDLRGVEHGLLAQVRDEVVGDLTNGLPAGWEVVAGEAPRAGLIAELEFAWTVAAFTKSNAIVIATDRSAVGVGAGDQSRVGAAERAIARAGSRADGAVAASDAFLPFRDGLDALADAGVVALVEPGGSRRDDEVIAAAKERGMTLVFTGRRHFRH
jgi:phosphoribosylaminoimidazolecarboxamide formyltransferase/IMP cyclohydrolase